jgi:hypothetical protein
MDEAQINPSAGNKGSAMAEFGVPTILINFKKDWCRGTERALVVVNLDDMAVIFFEVISATEPASIMSECAIV